MLTNVVFGEAKKYLKISFQGGGGVGGSSKKGGFKFPDPFKSFTESKARIITTDTGVKFK